MINMMEGLWRKKISGVSPIKPQKPKEERQIEGRISSRKGTIILIDEDTPNERKINLAAHVEVEDEYDPYEGDKILMQAEVAVIDESERELVNIVYIEPCDKQEKCGKVSRFDDSIGIIDGKYLFYKESLDTDYIPKVGDLVSFTAIDSLQEYDDDIYYYNYRCIQVSPYDENKEKITAEEDADEKKKKNLKIRRRKRHLADKNSDTQAISQAKLDAEMIEVEFEQEGEIKVVGFIIENVDELPCTLQRVQILGKNDVFTAKLYERFESITLPAKTKVQIKFEVKAKSNGSYGKPVVFYFEQFRLRGKIYADVLDVKKPVTDKNRYYTKHVLKELNQNDFIPGEKICSTPRFVSNRLGPHNVPIELTEIVLKQNLQYDKILGNLYERIPSLTHKLSPSCYVEKFCTLLFLEEIESLYQLRCYDNARAQFCKEGEYLAMYIENLAERRPSLCIGDRLIAKSLISVKEVRERKEKERFSYIEELKGCEKSYEGCIHKVKSNRILLKFDQRFHEGYDGEFWQVVFQFSRTNFRKQHDAIERGFDRLPKEFFFPDKINQVPPKYQLQLKDGNLYAEGIANPQRWFNPQLNNIQKQAVVNVMRGEVRPLPYIIYGPPGTGKTITLIEIILQIVNIDPDARILVGTPSNSASNLITERLITNHKSSFDNDILRVVSYNFVVNKLVPENLKEYCGTIEIGDENTLIEEKQYINGVRHRIPSSQLKSMKVIIGTCSTLGSLMNLSFKDTHFTHVIIDEAGQLMEPEIMIPITLIDPNMGQLILAGDPKQLGPITFSRYSRELGLQKPYLSRLLEQELYKINDDKHFNEKLVIQLIQNYRAISSIVNVYNYLFYDDKLVCQVSDEPDSPEMQCLERAQPALKDLSNYYPGGDASKIGVHFVPVRGKCMQGDFSPSWFNMIEAMQIFTFVNKLYELCKFTENDIGIITPYLMQVWKLNEFFENHNKNNKNQIKLPKIGTVEEFQGQERKIILVSTVRANPERLKFDEKFSLGFVKEPKRINVTISRAKSLLVVFGCEKILIKDNNWANFIAYTINHKTFHGDPTYVMENI